MKVKKIKKIERKILHTFKFFKREGKKGKGKKKIEIKPSVWFKRPIKQNKSNSNL